MKNLSPFLELETLFAKHGFKLWLIGGSSRDYLLKREFTDFDLVTDATPSQMKSFLSDGDFRFAQYGTVRLTQPHVTIEITTLRKESGYKDYRHPQSVQFIKDPQGDYVRRDFTINALYIDGQLKVTDYCGGLDDLKHRVLRIIGEPHRRFQEDPLRMLRAIRFELMLGFTLEGKTKQALISNIDLLEYLNPIKANGELDKILALPAKGTRELLKAYGVKERYE